MRLQLIVAATVAATTAARAQPADAPGGTANVRVYTDDDHVTVVSPSASVRAQAAASTLLTVDMTVDAVSAASVDVVTSASPRTVHDQRVELGVAGRYVHSSGWLDAGARLSHENDYDAARVRADVRRELAQRNTTLQLGYVVGYDVARSAIDEMFRATRRSHELVLDVGQLVSRNTVLDVVVDATIADGYHASPYRDVPIEQAGLPLAMRVAEQTPTRRASIAGALRVRQSLARDWFASLTYRAYRDDWSIGSHAATGELYHQVSERVLAGVNVRGYVQDAAAFYRSRYDDADGIPRFRTRDRTLGAMRSAYAALTADATLDGDARWHAIASLGAMRFWFVDFPAQRDRNAAIVHLGVSAAW